MPGGVAAQAVGDSEQPAVSAYAVILVVLPDWAGPRPLARIALYLSAQFPIHDSP